MNVETIVQTKRKKKTAKMILDIVSTSVPRRATRAPAS